MKYKEIRDPERVARAWRAYVIDRVFHPRVMAMMHVKSAEDGSPKHPSP